MKLSLVSKHAIVCGGTDGIGKSAAELLAGSGCEVTLVARNQEKLEMVKSSLPNDHGQDHRVVCTDFNEPDGLKEKINVQSRMQPLRPEALAKQEGQRVAWESIAWNIE